MLMVMEVDPRVLLSFEDAVADRGEEIEDPDGNFQLPLFFKWALPPLPAAPDLLILATELAGVTGTLIPVEVSATDTYASVTDAAQRTLSLVGRVDLALPEMFLGEMKTCDLLDRAHDISTWLLDRSSEWLAD